MCGGFSSFVFIIGIFVLLSLGVGTYIIQKSPIAAPIPAVSISPTPVSTSTPTPTSVAVQCVTGGCSGDLCLSEQEKGIVSACIYKPEFACYKKARCEVQQSGACGWTQTPELAACITQAKATPAPISSPASCDPPIECAAPPFGCHYQGSASCHCGKLVCVTPSPMPAVTPVFTPTPLPIVIPIPTPISTPSQSPSASPLPSPSVTEMRIEADDYGFYPAGAISFPAGTRVKLIFAVRTSNVYFGGLDFRSSKFSTVQASPGQTATAEFTAESSFTVSSYWPSSSEYKASLQVTVQ